MKKLINYIFYSAMWTVFVVNLVGGILDIYMGDTRVGVQKTFSCIWILMIIAFARLNEMGGKLLESSMRLNDDIFNELIKIRDLAETHAKETK